MQKILISGTVLSTANVDRLEDTIPNDAVLEPFFTPSGIAFNIKPKFNFPDRFFGELEQRSAHIVSAFEHYPKLGILLVGKKGTGKTLLGKKACYDAKVPTIVINRNFSAAQISAIFDFTTGRQRRFAIFFDEFEKNFSKTEQEELLSIFDGTVDHNNLVIICSNESISSYFYNRTGRMMYRYEYDYLDQQEIREILTGSLNDKDPNRIEYLISRLSIYPVNYDIMFSLVSELNRGVDPSYLIEHLNIKAETTTFEVIVELKNSEAVCGRKKKPITFSMFENPFSSSKFHESFYERVPWIESSNADKYFKDIQKLKKNGEAESKIQQAEKELAIQSQIRASDTYEESIYLDWDLEKDSIKQESGYTIIETSDYIYRLKKRRSYSFTI